MTGKLKKLSKNTMEEDIHSPILSKNIIYNKQAVLFILLGAFFITNALLAEFIGVKIFAVETSLGLSPLNWQLFGQQGSLSLSAGVLLWPVVFIITDIINEYFGSKGVKLLSYIGVGMISYAFIMIYLAIYLVPADFWIASLSSSGVPNMQDAFSAIFGQGAWIIVGSIVAFLVGQLIDAMVFQRIRKWTNERWLWLRATGSTVISQLIDSFLVLYIAFVLGPQQWEISLFLAVGLVNYAYKFTVAVLLTPTLYILHYFIDRFLGEENSARLRAAAIGE